MTDLELIRLFRAPIIATLAADGYEDVPVVQAYQPTQQGVNNIAVYYYKVSESIYGWKKEDSTWDVDQEKMVHTYRQACESTFQISTLVRQDPNNVNIPTASDLLKTVLFALQNQETIETFAAAGVGILRVTAVTNAPAFSDDFSQFEFAPSFDFTLLHDLVRITEDPVIVSTEYNIHRV